MLWLLPTARALDNPEAPDLVSQFLARAAPFEERLGAEPGGAAWQAAARAYTAFLDVELNRAYRQLLPKLDVRAQRSLTISQREWLRFFDAESRFLDRNWTPANFGSSSALSRTDYRTRMLKERVSALLSYRQNFPPGKP